MSLTKASSRKDLAEQNLSPGQPKSTTIVKYEKSSCLFCNEWFDAQTFTEHLIHCGQVLEECPNGCQAFIPRIRMRSHLKECPRTNLQSLNGQRMSVSMDRLDRQSDQRLLVIEQDVGTIRSVLNEEIRQRLHLITDVGNIRKQNQVVEDWTRDTDKALDDLRRQMDEEASQRAFLTEQNQLDFQYCCNVTQSLKEQVESRLDEAQKMVNQLSADVTFHQNQLNDNILKLEELIFENERLNREKFFQIEEFLQQINEDIKTRLTNSDYAISKQATLDYEVKNVKSIVCEIEERCDKLDRALHQTMQNLSDLETQMAMQQRIASVQNIRGHLIWRIKDYSKKLDESKQYDTILHSAMFSNKAFSYALRLDIYLNGKGTWKGRNMIACLNVLSGEYDPLLAWPCRLQAEIIIRDQCSNAAEAEDYVKTIFVRKKSDDFLQSNQYFHIPHKVITSRNYLRNDSMFIEVRVLK
ncbi:TNF receptor-associated factor 3 isoform X1 [Drosophila gunungcola]|uniref:TNF receptor-associated factor 3 isoform X1 n=1 Tax=Drosophila gunungcola TaxID=103775 RepID=UPI0022DED7D2|nr:TNF receptor-associated factor 3 isoform X1 [Drosophila gunungcola]